MRLVELEGEALVEAISRLAEAAREKLIPKLGIERVDGEPVIGSGLEDADHRRRLLAPAAAARRGGRLGARGRHDPPRGAANKPRSAGSEIELADAPNPRSPVHTAPPSSRDATLERGRGARQAPARALLRRPRPPQPPRDERPLVHRRRRPAPVRAAVAAAGVGPRGRRAERRQDPADRQRVAAAKRPGAAPPRPGPAAPRLRAAPTASSACAGAAPGARSATRCSTRGSSPGSATRSASRPAFGPGSARGAGSTTLSATSSERVVAENERVMRRPRSPRAGGRGDLRGTHRRRCPRCGGPDPHRAARATTTATAYWCPRCQALPALMEPRYSNADGRGLRRAADSRAAVRGALHATSSSGSATVAIPRTFPKGVRVFHEGDHSDACYIVR